MIHIILNLIVLIYFGIKILESKPNYVPKEIPKTTLKQLIERAWITAPISLLWTPIK